MGPPLRHPRRILPLLLATLLIGITLAGVLLAWLWPTEDLRDRITTQASEALGLTVSITGDISPALWPAPGIRLEQVTLAPAQGSQDMPVAQAAAIEVSLRWLPLLRGELLPGRVAVDAPTIHLDAARLDTLRKAGEGSDTHGSPRVGPLDVVVRDGQIDWRDEAGTVAMSASGVDLDVPALRWSDTTRSTGKVRVAADRLSLDGLTFSDLSLMLLDDDGTWRTRDWRMTALGNRGRGDGSFDLNASPPRGHLEMAFDALDLAQLPDTWLPGGRATGTLALQATLESRGERAGEWLRRLDGEVRLEGRDLTLHGMDLDAQLAEYRRTQRFSLVDAAAVAFMGPAWLLATKGSDFARLADGNDGGKTRIRQLVSDWEVKDGTARARDVALATPHNRLAVKASLDLAGQTIDQATVAAVDQRGCAVLKQKLHGPFSAPQTEATSVVEGLLGAPIDLFRQGLNAITGGKADCEVFYGGSVAAPSG